MLFFYSYFPFPKSTVAIQHPGAFDIRPIHIKEYLRVGTREAVTCDTGAGFWLQCEDSSRNKTLIQLQLGERGEGRHLAQEVETQSWCASVPYPSQGLTQLCLKPQPGSIGTGLAYVFGIHVSIKTRNVFGQKCVVNGCECAAFFPTDRESTLWNRLESAAVKK